MFEREREISAFVCDVALFLHRELAHGPHTHTFLKSSLLSVVKLVAPVLETVLVTESAPQAG